MVLPIENQTDMKLSSLPLHCTLNHMFSEIKKRRFLFLTSPIPFFSLSLFLVKADPLRWKSPDADLTGNKDQVCTSALCDLHICFINLKTTHEEFTDARLLKADDVFLSGLTHHLNSLCTIHVYCPTQTRRNTLERK